MTLAMIILTLSMTQIGSTVSILDVLVWLSNIVWAS